MFLDESWAGNDLYSQGGGADRLLGMMPTRTLFQTGWPIHVRVFSSAL